MQDARLLSLRTRDRVISLLELQAHVLKRVQGWGQFLSPPISSLASTSETELVVSNLSPLQAKQEMGETITAVCL